MDKEALRNVIARFLQLHPEDDFGIEECWSEMTDILSKDIDSTIEFFQNDCTDEEFYWLSSVFEDVAEKTKAPELIPALRNRLSTILEENYHQDTFQTEHMRKCIDFATYVKEVSMDIDYAEAWIDDSQQP